MTRDLDTKVFDGADPILLCIFFFGHHLESYFEKRGQNLTFIEIDKADLNYPCQELFRDGL